MKAKRHIKIPEKSRHLGLSDKYQLSPRTPLYNPQFPGLGHQEQTLNACGCDSLIDGSGIRPGGHKAERHVTDSQVPGGVGLGGIDKGRVKQEAGVANGAPSKLLQKWSWRGKKSWKRELGRSDSEQSLSLLSRLEKGVCAGREAS